MFSNRIELARKIQESLYKEVERQLEPPYDLNVLGYQPKNLSKDDLKNNLEREVKFRWRKFYSVHDSSWNWATFNLQIENNQFKIISENIEPL